jgi:hypothetical protein
MLERYAMKVARTVLRGGSGSNATSLPDYADPSTGSGPATPQKECLAGKQRDLRGLSGR